jgi:hypothetical protein
VKFVLERGREAFGEKLHSEFWEVEMMKSVIAAAAILAFGATSAAAACGWKSSNTVADLDVKTEQQQTAKQSTPADASPADASEKSSGRTAETDRTSERLQLAVDPRADDAANN